MTDNRVCSKRKFQNLDLIYFVDKLKRLQRTLSVDIENYEIMFINGTETHIAS